jgi:hypothetical protein
MYMSTYGGFYFDTDYKIKHQIPESILRAPCVLPISRGTFAECGTSRFRLGNAVIGSVPSHPFWSDFLAFIFSRDLDNLAEDRVEKITGPEGLTDYYVARLADFPDIVTPERELFHPRIYAAGWRSDAGHSSVGQHLCWGSWRSKDWKSGLVMLARRKFQATF